MARLIGEVFSPWTRKARWALDYCDVAYRYQEYVPFLSEPGLRLRLRQWHGKVSVPVLLADTGPVRGSFEIARYAALASGDDRLGDFDRIRFWDDISEVGLAAARTRVVRTIAEHPDALDESLPHLPSRLRPLLRPITRRVVNALDRKYAHLYGAGNHRNALFALRRGLRESGTGFVLDTFSYADITLCALLDAVVPETDAVFPGEAQRRCWQDDGLADEFADLLVWREQLRPYRASPPVV